MKLRQTVKQLQVANSRPASPDPESKAKIQTLEKEMHQLRLKAKLKVTQLQKEVDQLRSRTSSPTKKEPPSGNTTDDDLDDHPSSFNSKQEKELEEAKISINKLEEKLALTELQASQLQDELEATKKDLEESRIQYEQAQQSLLSQTSEENLFSVFQSEKELLLKEIQKEKRNGLALETKLEELSQKNHSIEVQLKDLFSEKKGLLEENKILRKSQLPNEPLAGSETVPVDTLLDLSLPPLLDQQISSNPMSELQEKLTQSEKLVLELQDQLDKSKRDIEILKEEASRVAQLEKDVYISAVQGLDERSFEGQVPTRESSDQIISSASDTRAVVKYREIQTSPLLKMKDPSDVHDNERIHIDQETQTVLREQMVKEESALIASKAEQEIQTDQVVVREHENKTGKYGTLEKDLEIMKQETIELQSKLNDLHGSYDAALKQKRQKDIELEDMKKESENLKKKLGEIQSGQKGKVDKLLIQLEELRAIQVYIDVFHNFIDRVAHI